VLTGLTRWIKQRAGLLAALGLIAAFALIGALLWPRMSVEPQNWRTDFSRSMIPLDEVVDGGVGRDGIPPIDAPRFLPASQVEWLGKRSPVIVVDQADTVRAYPLAVLIQHEIVNDNIGDIPIAVTFCPLCHSPMVYKRVVDGQVLRLGVTGYLYKSGFIMWDDLTESWWKQFTGVAVAGEYTGTMLDMVPSQVVGFAAFAERYPQGEVLVGDANKPGMVYGRNPYIDYDNGTRPLLLDMEPDRRLLPTGWVLSSVINDEPVAYPFDVLAAEGVVNDVVGDKLVVVFWQPGAASPLDAARIDESRDVGMAAMYDPRLPDGRLLTFASSEHIITDTQTNSRWNIFGEAIEGPLRGTRLSYLDCSPYFWFAWANAHPDTRVYQGQAQGL